MGFRDKRPFINGEDSTTQTSGRVPDQREVINQVWIAGNQGVSALRIAQNISCSVEAVQVIINALLGEGVIIPIKFIADDLSENQQRYKRKPNRTTMT